MEKKIKFCFRQLKLLLCNYYLLFSMGRLIKSCLENKWVENWTIDEWSKTTNNKRFLDDDIKLKIN